jgi:hypothetical protein
MTRQGSIVVLDPDELRALIVAAVARLAYTLGEPYPDDPAALAGLLASAQHARWSSASLADTLDDLTQAAFLTGLPALPHWRGTDRAIGGPDPVTAYRYAAIAWHAYLTDIPDDGSRAVTAGTPAIPQTLGDLRDSCPCGWRYIGDSATDLDDQRAFHDPGDSCCTCSGWLCIACASRQPHETCDRDCTECCSTDPDGYTAMDRQRRTARWWALTRETDLPDTNLRGYLAAFSAGHPEERPAVSTEEEATAFLHSLIAQYGEITHRG